MPQHNVTTSGSHLAKALVTPTGGGADRTLADIAHAAIAVASTDAPGRVELATNDETAAGTDTARAVTPAALAAQDFITSANVTYNALNDNGGVGAGASQVARGNHGHADATSAAAGFMPPADKAKLDGVEAGATADQSGAEIVAAVNTELGGTEWQQSGDGGSADLNIPGLPGKPAAGGADLVAIWDAEAAAHRHVPVAGLPAGRGIVAPAGDDPAISMELPKAVDRRDFLLGFTATGAVTTTKVATAALMDGLAATGVRSVPHMAALRTTIPPPGEAAVWLSGYSAPRDGGEGMFQWDSASVLPDNGGTVVAPDPKSAGRWVRAAADERINVRWFGAKGDGVTDDSDALIRMRNYCRQDRSKHYIISFPRGHYVYTKNNWLAHIGSFELIGNGSKINCTSGSGTTRNARVFNVRSIWHNAGDEITGGTPSGGFESGYLFKSVGAGNSILEVVDHANALHFVPGDRIFIHGFDQQFTGFPPNMRYFEWRVVTNIDTLNGKLTLDAATQNSYDDQWRDADYGSSSSALFVGKPRIMRLDRLPTTSNNGFYYIRYAKIRDFEILKNPTQPTFSNGLVVAADTLVLENVIHREGYLWPSENRIVEYKNCHFNHSDLDKTCGRVSFENCKIDQKLNAATGVNEIIVRNCETRGFSLGARRQAIENNIVIMSNEFAAWSGYNDSFPVRSLVWRNNTVINAGGVTCIINNGLSKSITAGELSEVNKIIIEDNSANRIGIIRQIDIGCLLIRQDLSEAQRVRRIYLDGLNWVIEAPWRTTVQPGGTFEFLCLQHVEVDRSILQGAEIPDLRFMRAVQNGDGAQGRKITLQKDRGFAFVIGASIESHAIRGFVETMMMRVKTPYAGDDTNPLARIALVYDDGSSQEVATLDLKKVGSVELTRNGSFATSGNTVVASLPRDKITRTLELRFRQGGNALSGTLDQMPQLIFESRVVPIG